MAILPRSLTLCPDRQPALDRRGVGGEGEGGGALTGLRREQLGDRLRAGIRRVARIEQDG